MRRGWLSGLARVVSILRAIRWYYHFVWIARGVELVRNERRAEWKSLWLNYGGLMAFGLVHISTNVFIEVQIKLVTSTMTQCILKYYSLNIISKLSFHKQS